MAFDGIADTGAVDRRRRARTPGRPAPCDSTAVDLDDGRFTGRVHADRDAWVMLKESYDPHWTATVDGKPVKPQMLAPSFVGVPVPAGDHMVAFSYRSTSSYPALFGIGVLTLLTIGMGPRHARVRRRRVAQRRRLTMRLRPPASTGRATARNGPGLGSAPD